MDIDILFKYTHGSKDCATPLKVIAGAYTLSLGADSSCVEGGDFIRLYLLVTKGDETVFESNGDVSLDVLMYWMQYVKYQSHLEEL